MEYNFQIFLFRSCLSQGKCTNDEHFILLMISKWANFQNQKGIKYLLTRLSIGLDIYFESAAKPRWCSSSFKALTENTENICKKTRNIYVIPLLFNVKFKSSFSQDNIETDFIILHLPFPAARAGVIIDHWDVVKRHLICRARPRQCWVCYWWRNNVVTR